jgi:hypothetical protein
VFVKLEDVPVSNDELRELARVAMRHYPGARGDCVPSWICDLAILPVLSFHAIDRLMHDGLVTWRNGWWLTEIGWSVLDTAAPGARIYR